MQKAAGQLQIEFLRGSGKIAGEVLLYARRVGRREGPQAAED